MTTIPFTLAKDIVKFKHLASLNKLAPVFEQLPTEEDFFISVGSIDWHGSNPRVIIDFGVIVLLVSIHNKEWTVIHLDSIIEVKVEYYLASGLEDYNSVKGFIREVVNKIIKDVELLLNKTKNAIA